MGRKKQWKRKKSSSSGDEVYHTPKQKQRGPTVSPDNTVSVSEVLNETNSILFEDCAASESVFTEQNLNLFKNSDISEKLTQNMASNTIKMDTSNNEKISTSNEIITYLQKIDSKIDKVEQKLEALDKLEKKVDTFDKELKSMWSHIEKLSKTINEKLDKSVDRLDNLEFTAAERYDDIKNLQQENEKLKDSITYLQSQSMRNNLIFCNIDEMQNEKPDDTEKLVRDFMVKKLKVAEEHARSIGIERAHRMGARTEGSNGTRKIVVKFTLYKDREEIRRRRKELEGSRHYIHEQFPPDVVAKRRRLVPKMKRAKGSGHQAWISYDTLFIDGKPVKD